MEADSDMIMVMPHSTGPSQAIQDPPRSIFHAAHRASRLATGGTLPSRQDCAVTRRGSQFSTFSQQGGDCRKGVHNGQLI